MLLLSVHLQIVVVAPHDDRIRGKPFMWKLIRSYKDIRGGTQYLYRKRVGDVVPWLQQEVPI
jgi:hypothetical protein